MYTVKKKHKLLNVCTLAIIWIRDWAVNQAYHANQSSDVLFLTSGSLSWKSPPHEESFLGLLSMKVQPSCTEPLIHCFYRTDHLIRLLERIWPRACLQSFGEYAQDLLWVLTLRTRACRAAQEDSDIIQEMLMKCHQNKPQWPQNPNVFVCGLVRELFTYSSCTVPHGHNNFFSLHSCQHSFPF